MSIQNSIDTIGNRTRDVVAQNLNQLRHSMPPIFICTRIYICVCVCMCVIDDYHSFVTFISYLVVKMAELVIVIKRKTR
jgi:hypothetical protein